MQPGPTSIYECPHCGQFIGFPSVLTWGIAESRCETDRWTDGYEYNAARFALPAFTACPDCRAALSQYDLPKLGEIHVPSTFEPTEGCRDVKQMRKMVEAGEWKEVSGWNAKECIEAAERIVQDRNDVPLEAVALRLHAWWEHNGIDREYFPPSRLTKRPAKRERDRQEIENIEWLHAHSERPEVKAEAARHLGRFDESIALMNRPAPGGDEELRSVILDAARSGSTRVENLLTWRPGK